MFHVISDVGGRSVHQRNSGNYIQKRRRWTHQLSGTIRIRSQPSFR